MSFLQKVGNIDLILQAGMDALQAQANKIGAQFGGGAIGILYHNQLHSISAPLNNNWKLAYDPHITFEGNDKLAGIDFVCYAVCKMYQSVMTKKPSTENPEVKLDYGQVKDVGSDCEIFKEVDMTHFEFYATFSGMDSKEDLKISEVAVAAMTEKARRLKKEDDALIASLHHGPGIKGMAGPRGMEKS